MIRKNSPGNSSCRQILIWLSYLVLLGQSCVYAEQNADPNFVTGMALFEQHQYDSAVAQFNKALQYNPDNAEIKFFLGLAYLGLGDLQLASRDLLAAKRLGWERNQVLPALARVLLQLEQYQKILDEVVATAADSESLREDILTLRSLTHGQLYRQQGDYEKAVTAFDQALTDQPQNITALFARAESYFVLEQLDKAMADIKKLHEMGAESVSTDFLEVKILLKKNDLITAEKRVQQILQASDADQVLTWLQQLWSVDPHPLAAGALLVRNYLQRNEPIQALTIARNVYQHHSGHPVALRALTQALLANKKIDSAFGYCQRLIDLEPHSAENWTLLAAIQNQQGKPSAANDSLTQALELQPDYLPAHISRIEQALNDKRYDEALAATRQLQVLTPDQGIGHKLEGDVYSHQEDFYRAELAYRNAYEKTPTAQGALLLSNAQYHAEKPEAALSTLQKWLAVQPADTPVRVQLATLLDRLGYQTDAIAEYEQLIEQNPENAIALNNLAWLYGTGDPKGLEYAERAVELAPERPEMLDTLGWLLVKSNKAEHGLLLLQQAIILAPEMPDIRFHLAFAYDRLGRTDEAREELDVLLNDTAENPRFTRSEELLKLLEKLKYQ